MKEDGPRARTQRGPERATETHTHTCSQCVVVCMRQKVGSALCYPDNAGEAKRKGGTFFLTIFIGPLPGRPVKRRQRRAV